MYHAMWGVPWAGEVWSFGRPGVLAAVLGCHGGKRREETIKQQKVGDLCGSVELWTRRICRTVGKRSKLDPSQLDGPWQAGASGYVWSFFRFGHVLICICFCFISMFWPFAGLLVPTTTCLDQPVPTVPISSFVIKT
jgi:hypothetical protein